MVSWCIQPWNPKVWAPPVINWRSGTPPVDKFVLILTSMPSKLRMAYILSTVMHLTFIENSKSSGFTYVNIALSIQHVKYAWALAILVNRSIKLYGTLTACSLDYQSVSLSIVNLVRRSHRTRASAELITKLYKTILNWKVKSVNVRIKTYNTSTIFIYSFTDFPNLHNTLY